MSEGQEPTAVKYCFQGKKHEFSSFNLMDATTVIFERNVALCLHLAPDLN